MRGSRSASGASVVGGWQLARSRAAGLLVFGLLVTSTVLALPALGSHVRTCTWVGVTASWNTETNWLCTSGVGPPTSDALAVFDGATSNANATIDATVNVAGLRIQSYTGTVTQGGNAITIGDEGFVQSSGTFTGSTAPDTLQPITVNGAFTLSGGTFTSTSQLGTGSIAGLRVSGDLTHSGGTFNHNGGRVALIGGNATVTVSGTTFSALQVDTTPTNSTKTISGSATVAATLTLTEGFVAGGTLIALGNVTHGASFDGGSATVRFAGTSAQTFGPGPGNIGDFTNVVIDRTTDAGQPLTINGAFRTTRNWTFVQGSLVTASAPHGPIFAGTQTITGSHTLSSVYIQTPGTVTLAPGTVLTTTNTLQLRQGVVNGGTFHVQGGLRQNFTGVSYGGGSALVVINGTLAQTFEANPSQPDALLNPIEIAKTSDTLTLTGAIRTASNWIQTAGGASNVAAGTSTLVFAGSNTITTAHGWNNVTFEGGGATYTLGSNMTVAGTLALTNGVVATGSSTLVANGTVTRSSGHVHGNFQRAVATGAQTVELHVGGASTYRPVTVAFNNVTAAGSVTARAVAGAHPDVGSSAIKPARSVDAYWTLTGGGGLAFDFYGATFQFVPGDVLGGADTSTFRVSKLNGTWAIQTAGTRTATTTQATGMTSLSDFVVGEHEPAALVFTSSEAPLASGATRDLTAEVRDELGNLVDGDSSTVVTFAKASGDGTVTNLGSATAASGVATRTVTGHTAGGITIEATATGLASDTTTFTVVAGDPAKLVYVSEDTSDLPSGTTRVLTVEIQDANGNLVDDDSTEVGFAQTAGSGSVTGLGSATSSGGVASITVTGQTTGPVTITASAAGLTDDTTTFTVVVGAAGKLVYVSEDTSDLVSGTSRVLTVEIRDAADNLVDDDTTVVTFAKQAGAGTVTGLGDDTAENGVATVTVTGQTAGPITIRASAGGFETDDTAFTVVAGPAAKIVVTSSTSDLAVGATRALTAEIQDAAGNLVDDDTTVVDFSQTAGSGSVSGLATATASDGVASLTVTGGTTGPVTISASETPDAGLADGSTTFTVVAAAEEPVEEPVPPVPTFALSAPHLGGFLHVDGFTLRWSPSKGGPVNGYSIYANGGLLRRAGEVQYEVKLGPFDPSDERVYVVHGTGPGGVHSPASNAVTNVPNLIGMHIDDALATLRRRGFAPGSVTERASERPTGEVIGQSPATPSYADVGSGVDLVVAQQAIGRASFRVQVQVARRIAVDRRGVVNVRVAVTEAARVQASLHTIRRPLHRLRLWPAQQVDAGGTILQLRLPAHLRRAGTFDLRLRARARAGGPTTTEMIRIRFIRSTQPQPIQPRRTTVEVVLVNGDDVRKDIALKVNRRVNLLEVNGPEVFEVTARPASAVEVVLVDVDVAGVELVRHLRMVFPDLRILAVAGSADVAAQARRAGAALVVVKPVSPAVISALLTQLLQRR